MSKTHDKDRRMQSRTTGAARYSSDGRNVQLRQRYLARRRKRKRRLAMARAVSAFILLTALVCVILFMTPLFNIRRINVSGNNVITIEDIDLCVKDLMGENLFKTDIEDVNDRLLGIAYIKDVQIRKNYFRTILSIDITERVPCAYLGLSGKYVLFDNTCKILAEVPEKPEGIPLIIGIDDSDNADINLMMGEERVDTMLECISIMHEVGISERVNNIDLSDLTSIKFRYEDRLDVYCGSSIDMDRKLRLFEASVSNNNLASNAKGTMDLSITGNAMYTP